MSNELFRLGRTVANFAFDNSLYYRGAIPLEADLMGLFVGRVTEIFALGFML